MTYDADDGLPLPATIDGSYRLTEHIFGSGGDRMYLAAHERHFERLLVSTMNAPKVSLGELYRRLAYSSPGLFELEHIGMFDEESGGQWEYYCGLVEVLPPGDPARNRIRAALPPALAVKLGREVGRILLAADQGGIVITDAQPECIWVEEEAGGLRVSGLTGRAWPFFRSSELPSYGRWPPFERRYTSPEYAAGKVLSERSLTFLVGLLIAEWATGEFPFEEAYSHYLDPLMYEPPSPIRVAPRLEAILVSALQKQPEKRPPLAELLDALEALGPNDLSEPWRM